MRDYTHIPYTVYNIVQLGVPAVWVVLSNVFDKITIHIVVSAIAMCDFD